MTPRRPNVGTDGKTANAPTEFGRRLRNFRGDRGFSLNELSTEAEVSKGYLSSLENDPAARRPSADVMYRLAKALGVTMSDLMGRELLLAPSVEIPSSLREFAEDAQLTQSDIHMLASIQFRGEQPQSAARWRFIYDSIRNSAGMDKSG